MFTEAKQVSIDRSWIEFIKSCILQKEMFLVALMRSDEQDGYQALRTKC
jgi:hypothetical protein